MGIGRINQNVYNDTNTSGIERTSTPYYPHPSAHRAWIHVYSADAGTLDIDILMSDGNWREIDTESVSANTLLPIEFTYVPLALRCRFTPSAGTGTAIIDMGYSGGGGIVS